MKHMPCPVDLLGPASPDSNLALENQRFRFEGVNMYIEKSVGLPR